MNIKKVWEALALLNDAEVESLASDRQISRFRSIIATAKIRSKTEANVYACGDVLLTNPHAIRTPSGSLRIGLNDFGITSMHDRTTIMLRPRSALDIHGHARIGRGCRIAVSDNATMHMKNGSYIVGLSRVVCTTSLDIGEHTAISWGVQLLDTDFHSINGKPQENRGIKIGDHVLIGSNSTVLKNVTVGNGCIIAANSVVRSDVPDGTMVMGNPARVVRENVTWD